MASPYLEIDGAPLPISGAPFVYDPRGAQWGKEGDEIITHSRRVSSLAQSSIELHWPVLPQAHASAILDYYYATIVPNWGQVTSLKVPSKVATDETTWGIAWKEYTGVDGEPIVADEPTWTPDGTAYRDFKWRFRGVCHALER